jgi:hypothetical protein
MANDRFLGIRARWSWLPYGFDLGDTCTTFIRGQINRQDIRLVLSSNSLDHGGVWWPRGTGSFRVVRLTPSKSTSTSSADPC